jgi:hypothetical protein
MLDTLSQLGGAPALQKHPIFGKYALGELLRQKGDGYAWAKGVHLYSELRPVEGLEIAQTDEAARTYLRVIEEYTHSPFAGVLPSSGRKIYVGNMNLEASCYR